MKPWEGKHFKEIHSSIKPKSLICEDEFFEDILEALKKDWQDLYDRQMANAEKIIKEQNNKFICLDDDQFGPSGDDLGFWNDK